MNLSRVFDLKNASAKPTFFCALEEHKPGSVYNSIYLSGKTHGHPNEQLVWSIRLCSGSILSLSKDWWWLDPLTLHQMGFGRPADYSTGPW